MDELDILKRNEESQKPKDLTAVITCGEIEELKKNIINVKCSAAIQTYIIDIVDSTRNADFIKLGVSPRGSIAMNRMAKAYAFVKGRDYVLPDDVKKLAPYVFAHRIILTSKGKTVVASNEEAIAKLMKFITVLGEN